MWHGASKPCPCPPAPRMLTPKPCHVAAPAAHPGAVTGLTSSPGTKPLWSPCCRPLPGGGIRHAKQASSVCLQSSAHQHGAREHLSWVPMCPRHHLRLGPNPEAFTPIEERGSLASGKSKEKPLGMCQALRNEPRDGAGVKLMMLHCMERETEGLAPRSCEQMVAVPEVAPRSSAPQADVTVLHGPFSTLCRSVLQAEVADAPRGRRH